MMELYTDQMHLKRVLSGDASPAWTSLSEEATVLLDPAFVPGVGGVAEDEEGKLRCPVRGCGKWFAWLGMHLDRSHPTIGGADRVRKLLDIPKCIPLMSSILRLQLRERAQGRGRPGFGNEMNVKASPRRGRGGSGARQSVAARNLRDQCDAQLAHRIIDVANRLGRSPTHAEFLAEYDATTVNAIIRVYGGWANALALCGLKARFRGRSAMTPADVLPALQAWYEINGDLPMSSDALLARNRPALPSYPTVLRALRARSWTEAMQFAASFLNIYGGRYGLLERTA